MTFQGEKGPVTHEISGQPHKDYFLANPPLQPKAEIADYVESKGVLVPRRFSDLDEALASGRPFVIRSEHPQDYAGASGILESLLISSESIAEAEAEYPATSDLDWEWFWEHGNRWHRRQMMKRMTAKVMFTPQDQFEEWMKNVSREDLREFCELNSLDAAQFASVVTYSYWEAIGGINRTVMADNAIEGRYHIFTESPELPFRMRNEYTIFENGKITAGGILSDDPEFVTQSLIDAYEQVRNLPNFDAAHCPIVEMQGDNGENYFLQYHQGVDFAPTTFVLDREPTLNEYSAIVARGATSPEGEKFDVGYHIPGTGTPRFDEEAAIDFFQTPARLESFIRGRQLQLIRGWEHTRDFFNMDEGHLPRSPLLKPQMSIALSRPDVMEMTEHIPFVAGQIQTFPVHVTSDGRKAYIRSAQ